MRNHFLDLLKLIGIIVVAFHHTGWTSMEHGYLPVEFFFIVSGYYIYKTYQKSNLAARNFFFHKFRRIAPTYYASLLLFICLFLALPQFYPGWQEKDILFSIIRDTLCLQATGISDLSQYSLLRFNPPDWYISSFLYGGLIVYILLKSDKYSKIILSSVIVITYSSYFLINEAGINDTWGYMGFMYMPLWRGIAGMSIGALCAMTMKSTQFMDFYNRHIQIHNFLALLSLIGISLILFIPTNHNFIGILLIIILTVNSIAPKGLSCYFKGKLMKYIPDISLEILLIHKFLIIVTAKVSATFGVAYVNPIKFCIFIIILIVGGLLFKYCINFIESKLKLLTVKSIQIAK